MNRKVEYVLGLAQPPTGHSLGINALVYNPDLALGTPPGIMFSGGSDGRVNAWGAVGEQTVAVAARDIHTNWVNDLLRVDGRVISCSSDTTVKLWDPCENRVNLVGHHTDYVKCLASYSPHAPTYIVSGGLDGHILGWDPAVADGAKLFDYTIDGDKGSVYSLACSLDSSFASGSQGVIASGSPDSLVRLWDPRVGSSVASLSGHTDNIRALLIRGNWLLSASSDSTIKQWDLMTGRLFHTYTMHRDAVWSLYSDTADLSQFYSGDRQGLVFKTRERMGSIPVCAELRGINSIVVAHHNTLWTATSDRQLDKWPNPDNWDAAASEADVADMGAVSQPIEIIKGNKCLIGHRVLNDKRRVLVCMSDGEVCLVDLIRGGRLPDVIEPIDLVRDVGEQLDSRARAVNTQDVLDNWCQVFLKAGQLSITLDERSYASTEVYADELAATTGLDLGQLDDEKRVNVGKWVLRNLLKNFYTVEADKYEQVAEKRSEKSLPDPEDEPQDLDADKEKEKETKDKPRFMSRLFGLRKSKGTDPEPPAAADDGASKPKDKEEPPPPYYSEVFDAVVADGSLAAHDLPDVTMAQDTRFLINESVPGAGAPTNIFEAPIGDLGHPEVVRQLEQQLPGWVGDLLLRGRAHVRTPTRVSFNVVPLAGSPGVTNGKTRLMAHPLLRSRKIMSYIIGQLKNNGDVAPELADLPQDQVLELFCQDRPLDPSTSLSTIRTHYWRSGGDVVINYKLRA